MGLRVLSKSIKNKKVLLRTDFNVPIKNGKILDDSRIKESLPTIYFLLKNNNQIFIVTHLGRPKLNQKSKQGETLQIYKNQKLILKPLAIKLARLLKFKIKNSKLKVKINNFDAYKLSNNLYLLENIRFYTGEEENNKKFAKHLASLADIFVNDAFSVCHRVHASIVGITKLLPSYAGLGLEKEVNALDKILKNPLRPLVCIIGGAKVETKLPLIKNFLRLADFVLVGGKIGFQKIPYRNKKLILPVDGFNTKDIGLKTIDLFIGIIQKAKTIFWNGPMGMFEQKKFEKGTKEIAQAIANSSAFSVAGGGETILALKKYRVVNKISYISTGGGATLEYLAGKELPGIKVLMKK